MPKTDLAQPMPFSLIEAHLQNLEENIAAQARAFDPAVEGYVTYVCDTHGKRLRPALALLSAGVFGPIGAGHEKLGVILELIHLATLIHDDIIDGADKRRSLPTANAKWGNSLSVLLGDSLFAHALLLASEFEDPHFNGKIAQAVKTVCSGEILQTQRRFDLKLSIADYTKMIAMKTAALFAVGTELGAYLNGASVSHVQALYDFGYSLGIAYQIYDDCLDLTGDEKEVGKTLGTDLAKGKLTLPILSLLAKATETQKAKVSRMLLDSQSFDPHFFANLADYEGALEESVRTGQQLTAQARKALETIPESPYRDNLCAMASKLDSLLENCLPRS